jgi:hypothetical protein
LAISYLEAMSERESRAAAAALRATRSYTYAFTYLAVSSPLLAARFISEATSLSFELLRQQVGLVEQLTKELVKRPISAIPIAPDRVLVTKAEDAAPEAADNAIEDTAKALAMAADRAVQAAARKIDQGLDQGLYASNGESERHESWSLSGA